MPHTLHLLQETLAVCSLPPDTIPRIPAADFWAIVRTPDELSLVVPEAEIVPGAIVELGWRGLYVEGPLPFEAIGILAGLTTVLAAAGVSIFSISTYRTDYLLLCQHDLEKACGTLVKAGYSVC